MIPEGLVLKPFQIEGINKMLSFLKSDVHGCYNTCEMGLGKSIMTIAATNELKLKKVLVICPTVMLYTWETEIKKWSTITRTISIIDNSKNINKLADVTIISYGLAAKVANAQKLARINWDCLVLDEAHFCKNRNAQRTKAILSVIWPKCYYKICLSGTPFTQGIVDGYTLFSALVPSVFNNFYRFAAKYTYKKVTPFGVQYHGIRNADELKQIIRSKFYLRYKKEEVLKELPNKVYQDIVLPKEYAVKLSDEEEQAHKHYIKLLASAYAQKNTYFPPPPTSVATTRREQGLLKVKPIVDFCTNILDSNIPIVLFAYHINVIERYKELLSDYKPAVVTGAVGASERMSAVNDFQNSKTNLFIGNIVAAGVGITLTRASTVVMAELDWSPANIDQAVSRCHRIGQKDTVNVYYFTVKDSIDNNMMNVIMDKVKTFEKVLE